MTPPSHRQAARFSSFFFRLFFFLDLLKHVHLHFKHVKEMASVSAAVTVFGRQAGDVCLCDTDRIHLAADTTMQHVLQGAGAQMGASWKRQKQAVSCFFFFLNSDKLCSGSLSRYV